MANSKTVGQASCLPSLTGWKPPHWAAKYSQHAEASEEQPLGLALHAAVSNLRGPRMGKGKAGE